MIPGKTNTKEFIAELDDIFESLEAVKGQPYANAVQQIFCMQNVHAGLLFIMADVIQNHGAEINLESLSDVVKQMEDSMLHEITHLLMPAFVQRDVLKMIENNKEITPVIYSCSKIMKEIMADIEILNKKQKEYQLDAGAVG